MSLTNEQKVEMQMAARQWYMMGHPEHSQKLKLLIETGELAPPHLLAPGGRLKPEKVISAKWSDDDIPPRYGKGSGKKPWQEFLIKFTEMDESVILKMSRDDCITIAEEKGIIAPLRGD